MQEINDFYFDLIAKNIRILREEAELSQEQLAEKLDCSREFVNRVENKKEKISLKMLIKLSAVLNVSPQYFFAE